jgi:hypothetical protein
MIRQPKLYMAHPEGEEEDVRPEPSAPPEELVNYYTKVQL